MNSESSPIVMELLTDPIALARAQQQQEQFRRNSAWLQVHASEVYSKYRGKCICVAGEELFVADTPNDALALGTASHPDDNGRFLRYIPRDRVSRIDAH
jgi:hypothetical protein